MWCCIGQRRKNNSNNNTIIYYNNNTNTDIDNNNTNNNSNNNIINCTGNNSNLYKCLFQQCIPDEVKLHIFSFLTANELCKVSLVSRDMRGLAADDVLWMKFFVKIIPKDKDKDELSFCPPARVCHSAVVHKTRMIIYGGHIPDPLNYIRDVKHDMHAFSFDSSEWTPVTPDPRGHPFPTKTEHTAVVHQNTMYLFGGYSNGTTGYSDVDIYSFDLETNICQRVVATGQAPTDRSAHTAVVYGDSMYVLGGWDGVVSNNDFHAFHIPSKVWSLVPYVGVPPPSVRSHATVVYKDSMLVFGGYGETVQHPTSLYMFHFLESRWEEINLCPSPSPSLFPSLSSRSSLSSSVSLPPFLSTSSSQVAPNNKQFYGPCGRSRFRMVYHQESLWVFGGWDRQSYFADLWRYRLDTRTWQQVPAAFELQGVGQHSLVVNQGYMYLYGGYCSVSKAPHPHLYVFRLPSHRNAEA